MFGLGDSVSYAENYADASGELHDVFQGLGCNMIGYTSQEGYQHKSSKAIRGESFCGLLLDAVTAPRKSSSMNEGKAKNNLTATQRGVQCSEKCAGKRM